MDGLLSVAPNCAKPLLSYLLPYSRTFNCTSKTTGWFTKGAEIDPNLPHANKVLLQVAHSYIHWWTSFSRTNCAQAVAILPSSIFPTFNCTSKTTGWFTRAEIDPNLPHANKVLLKVAHAFLYTLMDFFQSHQTVPKPLLSYLLPYSRTFNCTSKTTGWLVHQRAEIDPNLPR
jgi:hypothetical protein